MEGVVSGKFSIEEGAAIKSGDIEALRGCIYFGYDAKVRSVGFMSTSLILCRKL